MPIAIDLARVELLREAVLAEFTAKSHRWQALQAAALAGMILGLVGHLGGSLGAPGLLAAWVLLGLLFVVSHLGAMQVERQISQDLRRLPLDLESMKSPEAVPCMPCRLSRKMWR